ncbi:WD40 repeat-like protein [Pluteus cervinus]|uniref:WD40 repeat-like protein n=1 Tax=Pluteus cervinus TaxID=181527 RepID=A0ACD3AJV6_9AGAR|nr:WD40 repeat-like protein [Pluteus cervinus]
MEALIARADSIQPFKQKRKVHHAIAGSSKSGSKGSKSSKDDKPKNHDTSSDRTLHSVSKHTTIPKSLVDDPNTSTVSEQIQSATKKNAHIANKKLRGVLNRNAAHNARSKVLVDEAEDMLLMEDRGYMEVEGDLEKTWRIGQADIAREAGGEAAKGRIEWKLEGGPYKTRYTRNGRHLAIAGRLGHVATFDWQTGTLHSELQLQETCRDVTFLQDQSHYAVAQNKYVFIYDRDGVELHCLKAHIEPTHLEFLPYHWLLATIGNAGYLKYQDTSTGQLLVEHRTKFGSPGSMTQNPHTAVIYVGHQNGCVTLWTPNLPHPAVQVLAHLGPVVSVGVDPSEAGGRYMATAGRDGCVKIWDCRNWKGAVREWNVRGSGDTELDWSARGSLAVSSGGTVNVYNSPAIHQPHLPRVAPPLYLTHPIPQRPLTSVRFTPFQDMLMIGHSAGVSSILVPSSGEPNFDSSEADPFENKRARREREVKGLLDKVQPDMISLDPEFVGSLVSPSKLTTGVDTGLPGKPVSEVPYARRSRYERLKVSGKAADEGEESDEGSASGDKTNGKKESREEREKRKMRGKGKSLKRYLRKQRKNIIDPTVVAIRAKLEKQKEEQQVAKQIALSGELPKKKSALDRFKT